MEGQLCVDHNKEYEMFCFEEGCPGVETPMCSLCMCEHVKKHHLKGAKHISSVVDEQLTKVDKEMAMTNKQQEQIQAYHDRAEAYLRKKDKVKAELEGKLERLLILYTNQKEMASDKNTAILQCHEKVMKEMKQCEHKIKEKINDPKRIERKIRGMMKEHSYWKAYIEVNRALEEDTQLNDRDIKTELAHWEQLTQDFEEQLNDLAVTPAHLSDYKKIQKEHTEITEECARLKSMNVEYTISLEALTESTNKHEEAKLNIEQIRAELTQAIGKLCILINQCFVDKGEKQKKELEQCQEQLKQANDQAQALTQKYQSTLL